MPTTGVVYVCVHTCMCMLLLLLLSLCVCVQTTAKKTGNGLLSLEYMHCLGFQVAAEAAGSSEWYKATPCLDWLRHPSSLYLLLPRQCSADLSVPKIYFCVTCTCLCTSGDSRLGRNINSVYFIGTFSSLVPKSSHPGNTQSSGVGDLLLCLHPPVPWQLMFRFYKREGGTAGAGSSRVGQHSSPADWTRKGYCFMKDNASFHHGFQRVNSGPAWQQVLLLTEPP